MKKVEEQFQLLEKLMLDIRDNGLIMEGLDLSNYLLAPCQFNEIKFLDGGDGFVEMSIMDEEEVWKHLQLNISKEGMFEHYIGGVNTVPKFGSNSLRLDGRTDDFAIETWFPPKDEPNTSSPFIQVIQNGEDVNLYVNGKLQTGIEPTFVNRTVVVVLALLIGMLIGATLMKSELTAKPVPKVVYTGDCV